MNDAMYQHAKKVLDDMSEDDLAESMVKAGWTFTSKDKDPTFVTFTCNTARLEEFRKAILKRCREQLEDDAWAFRKSFGDFGPISVVHIVVAVFTDADAALLKLTAPRDIKVEVSDTEPRFKESK